MLERDERGIVVDMADHNIPDDVTELFTPEFWDARYSSAESIWSGNPNPHLVELVGPIQAGSALDVGSGEGADAIWLAEHGWQVTGVDISRVALDRAAAQAVRAGEQIAARIRWQQADLFSWQPPMGAFDLVSAQFMQVPRDRREALHRGLAAAVRPGGMLLVVGHHPSDADRPQHLHDFMFTADEVTASLDPVEWQIVVETAPERAARDADGLPVTRRDAVLAAIRRP